MIIPMMENQNIVDLFFSLFFFGISIRTTLWHLKNWQLREYRLDRMKSYFQTKEGRTDLCNFWFFRGILPRPKQSFRILLILIFLVFFVGIVLYLLLNTFHFSLITTSILLERTLWFWIFGGVQISALPVWIQKNRLYCRAKKVINKNKNIVRIGITGSYGKSSTKEILVYLLENALGKKNVLFNPANNNNEIAIARLILKNRSFFSLHSGTKKTHSPRVAIFEIGAYRRGEIKTVCNFVQPHIGILTGLNEQHIELFGSQENISRAKFELAEFATKNVFFNADNENLNTIFDQRKIESLVTPVSEKSGTQKKAFPNRTEFEWRGEKCVLPWGGEFFVTNALLALECAHETFDIAPKKLTQYLSTLPPLKRALNIQNLKNGAILLEDLYSANPDGVMGAIKHLSQFKGKKVFIGIPLRELGKQAESAHTKIFEALHEIGADIFWLKNDFSELGKKICGQNFHLIFDDFSPIKRSVTSLKKEDAILLESRLPESLIKIIK